MTDLDTLCDHLVSLPDFDQAVNGDEFSYISVPLCILDAIFSINARYEGVRAAVLRYAKHYGLPVQRGPDELPAADAQVTVSQFIDQIASHGPEGFARDILRNRSRTSTRGGILKAAASLQFAEVLRDHGVQVLQDLHRRSEDAILENDLRAVHGQGSGISVRYFFMLAGADHLIKPDRMILRFLSRVLGRPVCAAEAQELLSDAADRLRQKHSSVTAQSLDYVIWSRERVVPQP
jgi:hypothetical protein